MHASTHRCFANRYPNARAVTLHRCLDNVAHVRLVFIGESGLTCMHKAHACIHVDDMRTGNSWSDTSSYALYTRYIASEGRGLAA
jgi:hypothetical protein